MANDAAGRSGGFDRDQLYATSRGRARGALGGRARLQPVDGAVLGVQVAEVGCDRQRLAGSASYELRRGELAAVAVEVPGQPVAQRPELARPKLHVEIADAAPGRGEELGAHDVAQRVALEGAADDATVPVHVLHHAVA